MTDYSNLSDAELIILLKASDRVAFTELFQRYNRLLFIHAYKLLNDKEEAKDVVQELFVSLWDNISKLSISVNFAGFLYSSIRNRVFNMIIHKKVQSRYLESIQNFVEKGEAQTDHLLRTKNLQSIIEKEISFLPAKMREIFVLSRQRHLSHKEIAAHLDISEKTVRNQITNALKILRLKLGLMVYLVFIFFY